MIEIRGTDTLWKLETKLMFVCLSTKYGNGVEEEEAENKK